MKPVPPRTLLRGAALSLLAHAAAVGAMTLESPPDPALAVPESPEFRCRMQEPRLRVASIGRRGDARLWSGLIKDAPSGLDEDEQAPGVRFVPEEPVDGG